MKIIIIVATHKKYHMPNDSIYLPVRVGSSLTKDNLGYQNDNEGDNISSRNPYYSELTALYWGWKNLDVDYVGLVHYRRYLGLRVGKKTLASALTTKEAESLCQKYDIILPNKRRYYIESNWSHYKHIHDISHLEKTKEIIRSQCPDYSQAFEKVMNRTWGHMFNMFIIKKELMNAYCSWLFPILFELEKKVDFGGLSSFDARLIGRVSEFLLDVWIEKNNYPYTEIKMIPIGGENWPVKIKSFLLAKFFGKKYSQSR